METKLAHITAGGGGSAARRLKRHLLGRLRRPAAVLLLLLPTAAWAEPPTEHLVVDQFDSRYDDLFRHYASRYFGPFVDWRWFKAQAVAESMLNAGARSPVGAQGLMQLMPSTFDEIRRERPEWDNDITSPLWNVAAGLYYNRMLYRKWNGTFDGPNRFLLTLASYNAGFYRVRRALKENGEARSWDDIKQELPAETRFYVKRIRELMAPQPEMGGTVVASIDPLALP